MTIPSRLVVGSPTVYGGTVNTPARNITIGPERFGIDSNVLIAKTYDGGERVYYEMGYDITTGKELWVHGQEQSVQTFFTTVGSGIYAAYDFATATWVGHDIKTGQKLWTSDPIGTGTGWADFVGYGNTIANGVLYTGSWDGYMTAINTTNGKTIWKFFAGNAGASTPYGSWPMWGSVMVGGGVVYTAGGQESPSNPLYPGYRLFAINATTGQKVWDISGYFSVKAIADGYLMAFNSYDSKAYIFGKGPSKTTISAPDTGVTTDTPITITGSVTDIAAGTQTDLIASNYPNGLPAVSDASQTQFMQAVYMQQQMPTNITGVPVILSVIDSNGNYRQIGTTTSNARGTYGFTWTPDIPGDYTVIAEFAGSESYYGSSAQTYFYASAPAPTPAPTQAPGSSTADIYLLPGIIAIIVAIAIVGAVLALIVTKKRP